MLTYKQAFIYFLILQYCLFGLRWIELYAFNDGLSNFGQAVVVALLLIVIYPLLAWRRHSPWVRIGSFWSWLLLALGAGVLTLLVALGVDLVRHFTR